MSKTNKPAFKLLKGAEAIDAAIKSIKNRGKRLDRDIQIAALSAMQHHAEHGDVTLINRLIDAMPQGSRVNALRRFIDAFGAVRYDTEAKAFVHVKGAVFALDGAQKVFWYEFKPETAYQPIDDPMARIDTLIKAFEKDRTEAGQSSKVSYALLNALREAKKAQPEPQAEVSH